MATSTSCHTSEACLSIPPVLQEYTPKGAYKPHGGFDRVYVTGVDSSGIALIIVYDIFGYFPQTLQGADILAQALNAQVFMPDFLKGNTFSIEKFPPKNKDDKEELGGFFVGDRSPPATATKLVNFAKVLKKDGFKKTGAIGYCWGGKAVNLGALQEGSPLDAISIVHPAAPAVEDVMGLTIPLGLYFSKDEPRDKFDQIVKILSDKPFVSKNDSKYYSNMFHGWAAARANLSDIDNKREYEDLYSRVAAFFKQAFDSDSA